MVGAALVSEGGSAGTLEVVFGEDPPFQMPVLAPFLGLFLLSLPAGRRDSNSRGGGAWLGDTYAYRCAASAATCVRCHSLVSLHNAIMTAPTRRSLSHHAECCLLRCEVEARSPDTYLESCESSLAGVRRPSPIDGELAANHLQVGRLAGLVARERTLQRGFDLAGVGDPLGVVPEVRNRLGHVDLL